MKLISSASLIALAGSVSAAGKGAKSSYVILSPPVTQMQNLHLDLDLAKTAFGLSADTDLSNPDKKQEAALNHLEVQLKHIFWLVHDYKSMKFSVIKDAWDEFQAELINYGCHCFVNGYTVGGAGPAQDKIDLACKEYSRCIRCIDVDRVESDYFTDRVDECTAHQPYYSKLKKDPSSVAKFVMCGRGKEDGGRQSNCQISNCKCDQQFTQAVADWWKRRNSDLQNMYNKDGINSVCVNEVSNMGPPDGCCGPYPDRRAYWTSNGRDCCGVDMKVQELFHSDTKQCVDPSTGTVDDKDIL